jgi:L-threonylcarbamoyladenylate synthase
MVVSIERDGAAEARRALERCIAEGGVAVFPADGLYGLACDPSNRTAIARVHAIKGRDDGKPSAVMFFSPLAMRELISAVGALTREAIAALLPGPVTLVVDNPGGLYPLACREDRARLGVRLIDGPLAGVPRAIFQTSANRSGEPAPRRFADLDPRVAGSADLALDGGELTGLPSTVVDVTAIERGGEPVVLREGALSGAEARRLLEPARGS